MDMAQTLARIRMQISRKAKVVGWAMTPEETQAFFKSLGKTVLTLYGYSSYYEDRDAMFKIVEDELAKHSPAETVVNIGATRGGLGAAYPLAKSKGFTTTGIVSTLALQYPNEISKAVDYVCFIEDTQWGGSLPNSGELSPTSRAMVECSDILIGIGGNEVARDEMLYGRKLGKPIRFHPAEISHQWAIRRAKSNGRPQPESFWGAAHELFGAEKQK